MNRENENVNTPDVDDESTIDPHPFTEGEPVRPGQRADDPASEADPGTDGPTFHPYPDADREVPPTDTNREEPYLDATREEPYADADREDAYAGADREDAYAETTREDAYAGVDRGEASGIAEFEPLFDETQASDFQRRWGHIQSGFVEDPEGAVRLAGDLTDNIVTSLTRALGERRHALGDSARNGDTEQLRLVLRQYREVLEEVTSL
jgi:hypothetical protein